jgi:hypothetical protein
MFFCFLETVAGEGFRSYRTPPTMPLAGCPGVARTLQKIHPLPNSRFSLQELRADILLMASLVRRSLGNAQERVCSAG